MLLQRKRKIEDLKAKLVDVCKKLKAVEAQVDKVQAGREDSVSSPLQHFWGKGNYV